MLKLYTDSVLHLLMCYILVFNKHNSLRKNFLYAILESGVRVAGGGPWSPRQSVNQPTVSQTNGIREACENSWSQIGRTSLVHSFSTLWRLLHLFQTFNTLFMLFAISYFYKYPLIDFVYFCSLHTYTISAYYMCTFFSYPLLILFYF